MYEESFKIFDYLPLEAGSENLYIQHLWGSFKTLNEKEEPVRAFSILPFHLLFMFTIQYKLYRISAHKKEEYLIKLNDSRLYDDGMIQTLTNNAPIPDENGNISSACSVRNLSFIPEKRIFDFFEIINVDSSITNRCKEIVEIRGRYAHANGAIEEEIESKIDEYLDLLENIQNNMLNINNEVAENWIEGFLEDEEISSFVQERLLSSNLCKADFYDGKLKDYFESYFDEM